MPQFTNPTLIPVTTYPDLTFLDFNNPRTLSRAYLQRGMIILRAGSNSLQLFYLKQELCILAPFKKSLKVLKWSFIFRRMKCMKQDIVSFSKQTAIFRWVQC
jgi:hypothetical protein